MTIPTAETKSSANVDLMKDYLVQSTNTATTKAVMSLILARIKSSNVPYRLDHQSSTAAPHRTSICPPTPPLSAFPSRLPDLSAANASVLQGSKAP